MRTSASCNTKGIGPLTYSLATGWPFAQLLEEPVSWRRSSRQIVQEEAAQFVVVAKAEELVCC